MMAPLITHQVKKNEKKTPSKLDPAHAGGNRTTQLSKYVIRFLVKPYLVSSADERLSCIVTIIPHRAPAM